MKKLTDWYAEKRTLLYSIVNILFFWPKCKRTLLALLVALDSILIEGEPVYTTYIKES